MSEVNNKHTKLVNLCGVQIKRFGNRKEKSSVVLFSTPVLEVFKYSVRVFVNMRRSLHQLRRL